MFGLFKKKEDKRDLENLIYDIAEYGRNEDFHKLYEMLDGRELYLPVDPSSLPKNIEPGSKIVTDSTSQVRFKNVVSPSGDLLVPVATNNQHPLVSNGYVGMEWFSVLNMTLKIPEAWGILVQGQTSYVGFDKERINYILNLKNA